jgi:serine protease Do
VRPIAAIAVGLVSVGISVGISFGLTAAAWGHEAPTLWTSAPARHGKGIAGLADLAERARAAVVHVRGEMADGATADESDSDSGRTSIGTGFVINKDGYILTNEHVVRGVIDLRVRLFDGRELPACVVGADVATDLALLKVTTKRPLPVLALGDSTAVRVGEPVIAIGNPYGFNHSVTAGIVSAKERVVDRANLHEPGAEDLYSFFIQTDASINLGNSGGPLIDASGAVIAVNAAFWAGHPLQPAQGIGFAIPINMAKALLPRLMETGTARRAYLGVDAQPIDPALEAALKLPSGRGALIASVEKGSPAEAAGLEPGDVVVGWNGGDIASSEDFKIDAQLSAPGARIKIALLRDGKKAEHEIIPRAAPVKEVAPPHPSSCSRAPEPLMANVDDFDVQVTPAHAGKPASGVMVTRVTDHSAAAQAGLRVGDAVLRIGKANVLQAGDVAKALGAFKLGDPVPVLVRRSGFDFWMAFTRR